MSAPVPIDGVDARACTIPTDEPEADGTLEWDSTTVVLVTLRAQGARGVGYSYADAAAAGLLREKLAPLVVGENAMDVRGVRERLLRRLRNLGRPGLVAMAVSAVDIALWDLKARLLDLPLAVLLGAVRDCVPVYGSGGFTSYSADALDEQLRAWAEAGLGAVKMKVGADPADDPARVAAARRAVGDEVELFVDANGAYDVKQALGLANAFAEQGVSWFEEPVSSDDLGGLASVAARVPPPMEVAAGEYGFSDFYFLRMLAAGSVDVLQADATRCCGITGFLDAAVLARAWHVPLSSHTAPSAHLHACCAALPVRHMEWFHDHVRIERMLFDGFVEPVGGRLSPDPARPGLGIELREDVAARFAA